MENISSRIRSYLFLVLVLLFVIGSTLSVSAAQSRYIDQVGVLSAAEAREIRVRLDQVSKIHNFDVVIAVVGDLLYGPAHLYAADLFEEWGFGLGFDQDGAILLIAMEDRDMGFAALGYGITVFTSEGQDYLDKLFLPALKEDRYFDAFSNYIDGVDDFLNMAKAGTPYVHGNIPTLDWERRDRQRKSIAISIIVGAIVAFVVAQSARRKLKSVYEQQHANVYLVDGSMRVRSTRDIFLYRNLSKVQKEEKSSDKSFRTSSGRDATGHSSKF